MPDLSAEVIEENPNQGLAIRIGLTTTVLMPFAFSAIIILATDLVIDLAKDQNRLRNILRRVAITLTTSGFAAVIALLVILFYFLASSPE